MGVIEQVSRFDEQFTALRAERHASTPPRSPIRSGACSVTGSSTDELDPPLPRTASGL